ncbi:MAG: DUF6449 domain-containing protein [Lachnospiraceae bacterium]|nr:DUF6449 domain-containing protein [Lachnospiraceae bacterium]
MTSKISFYKLVRQSMKERSWLTVLVSVVGFLAIPCYLLLEMQRQPSYVSYLVSNPLYETELKAAYVRCALRHLNGGNGLVTAMALVAAVLAAFSGFRYLHEKEKNDLVQSAAVLRHEMFAAVTLAGFLMTVGPYVIITLMTTLLIPTFFGILSATILTTSLLAMLFYIIQFTAFYLCAVLAVILTGRLLTGALTFLMLMLYPAGMVGLVITMMAQHFATYYTSIFERCRITEYILPFLIKGIRSDGSLNIAGYLVLLGLAVLFFFLCRFFYGRRPAEAAGNALTYPRSLVVIKCLVTIPMTVGLSEIASDLFGSFNTGWYIFSLAAAALLVGSIIEFLENHDIHQCVRHWKSTALSFLLASVFFAIFAVDPFGYDRYLPETDDIEAIGISQENYYQVFGDYYDLNGDKQKYGEMLIENSTENFMPLYELAKAGIERAQLEDPYDDYVYDEAAEEYDAETDAFRELRSERQRFSRETFVFVLKNGKTVYRSYPLEQSAVTEAFCRLTEDPAYREATYPYDFHDVDTFDAISLSESANHETEGPVIALSEEERVEFLAALKEDMIKVPLSELLHEELTAVVTFYTQTENGYFEAVTEDDNACRHMRDLAIYPQYKLSLAFLERKGFIKSIPENNYTVERLEISIGAAVWRVTDAEGIRAIREIVRPSKWNEDDYAAFYINEYGGFYSRGYSGYTADPEKLKELIMTYGTYVSDGEAMLYQ